MSLIPLYQSGLCTITALSRFLVAFLVVGLFDRRIDAPRLLFLSLLLGGYGGFRHLTEFKERHHG